MRTARAGGPWIPIRAAALGAILAIVGGACGSATSSAPVTRPPIASDIAAAITEDGLRARLEAIEATSAEGDGYRTVGSPGYDAAADLVEQELRAAGWAVTVDAYDGLAFEDPGGSTLEVGGRTFDGADVLPLAFAPAGTVEGPVVVVDWDPAAFDTLAKGCTVSDYGALPANAIVVVRTGDCLRREQVLAAQQAGAAAFVAVYPLAPDGVAYRPTLIEPTRMELPAAGVAREVADALVAAAEAGGTARLETHASTSTAPTRSILADLPGSEPGQVVMLGAHLDSVLAGPGINDNGSGVAALLEIAHALGGTRSRATIRLAFWSGEELGLHGSYRYATSLTDEGRRAIVAYLNLDMIASPNGFAGVYDEPGAPAGSDVVQELLAAAVTRAGGTPVGVDLGGGADHRGFAQAGIVTGGVFSGAAERVTAEQAAASGSSAGEPADGCYHQACDTVANANLPLARLLAAATADTLVTLAANPERVAR